MDHSPSDLTPDLTEMLQTRPGSAMLDLTPAIARRAEPLPAFVARRLAAVRAIGGPMMAAVVVLAAAAVGFWPAVWAMPAGAAAGALALLIGLAQLSGRLQAGDTLARARRIGAQLADDPDTVVLTDAGGTILSAPAASALGPPVMTAATPPLALRLEGWCAEPSRVIDLLLEEVGQRGQAQRAFRRGARGLRLTAHRVGPGGGPDLVLWRFARIDGSGRRGVDVLGVPVLTLAPDGQPLAVNPALRRLIDLPDASAPPGAERAPAPGASEPQPAALGSLLAGLAPVLAGSVSPVALTLPGGLPATAYPVPARDGPCDVFIVPNTGSGTEPDLEVAGLPRDHEDIPVALVQINHEGRIYGTNRAARLLLGLAPTESRFLWEVVEGLGRPVSDWLLDAREGRALNRPEILKAPGAGAEAFVQIILRRAAAPAPPGALVAVVSDATELKSLESRFVQSQKMQAIGQLAGGIAHDFNNLLTAITGHCDLLLMGRDLFDPDYGDLQQIQQNANRAAALVRQLLAFSRKQTLQPETLSVESMLEDVMRLLGRLVGERIALRVRHDPALRPIRADRRQLEQVIVNLVVNARDAMPMGGTIRVETEALTLSSERRVDRARIPAGDWSVIRVIDTGVGIPAHAIDKIFEPFFTTKRPGEGTGLGLSTAYGIVKQMGGFIFVDSREGSGTTFSLYFAADTRAVAATPAGRAPIHGPPSAQPAAGAQPMATPAPRIDPWAPGVNGDAGGRVPARAGLPPGAHRNMPPAAPSAAITDGLPDPRPAGDVRLAPPVPAATGRAATILLVEDEAPVRAFAARALRLKGYQVLESPDGEGALEIVTAARIPIDAVVTDVIMPGLDGPSWVAQALTLRPGLPVIFVSGYIEDTLTEALSRTPNAVFLEKPFSLEALSSTIAAQIEAAQRRG